MPRTMQTSSYRAPRLFVEGALAEGVAAPLTPEQNHYLTAVMRRQDGDEVICFNGRDGEWAAAYDAGRRGRGDVRALRMLRPQPEPSDGAWLLFAAIKRGPMEMLVEKAVELGVTRLAPVRTSRSNTDRINQSRLGRIAIEAAEQCGRLDVPEVSELQPLEEALAAWPPRRRLILLDETGEGAAMPNALQDVEPGPFGLLVGPEGGFDEGELDRIRKFDFSLGVGLGPRILRAETAAVVGLAMAQFLIGDMVTGRTAPQQR